MDLTFVQIASFVSKWKRLGLTDDDLSALEQSIMHNPDSGDVMRGSGGARKIRFAPPSWNTGKSGATRVCYVTVADAECCYFLAIYPKNEKPSLSLADRNALRATVDAIKYYHRP